MTASRGRIARRIDKVVGTKEEHIMGKAIAMVVLIILSPIYLCYQCRYYLSWFMMM